MKNIENKIVIIVSIWSIIGLFFLINMTYSIKNEENPNDTLYVEKILRVDDVIKKYENETLIFSQNVTDDFVSLIVKDDTKHKTVIIDNKNGRELKIESLIKEDKLQLFWDKVYELLSLKYPLFILDGLKNSEGNIYYEIKENEMVIYFEYFDFGISIPESIKIKINYNEVRDYLNFSYKLDSEYLNESAYDYDKSKKAIAITFDDGPNPNTTNRLVEILNNNKARATFFMLGSKMKSNPKVLLNVYNSGFEIGSHTYSHINMKKTPIKDIEAELKETSKVYNNITNDAIKLVRPPYGSYNTNVIDELNYPFVTWNIDTNDWRYHDENYIANHILENVSDGSIILMHDTYETTIKAVDIVLPKLYALGYQVVTVSDLANLKGKTINSHEVYSYFK